MNSNYHNFKDAFGVEKNTKHGRWGGRWGRGRAGEVESLTQVYDKSGKLIAEHDPNGGFSLEDLHTFAEYYASQKGSLKEWLETRKRRTD